MNNIEYYNNKIKENRIIDVRVYQVENVTDNTILFISGGFNGHGVWNYYIKQIANIIDLFPGSYVLGLTYDALDDVWYLKLVVKE